MKKPTVLLSAAVLLVSQLTFFGPASPASATTGSSSMSDADFFGVWNSTTQTWSTPPKLDYAGFSDLASVEAAAKTSDYTQAKSDLELYMRDRAPRVAANEWVRNTAQLTPLMDDILTPLKETYVTTFSVSQSPAIHTIDVLAQVAASMQGSKQVPFILIGRTKGTALASFYSRDQDCSTTALTNCKPTLQLTYTDATGSHTASVVAAKDTFIRGNDPAPHGSESIVQVADSGAPFDSDTRKGYLSFDLSALEGTITQAQLSVAGSATGASPMDVMLYQSGDSAWDENTLTFANHQGKTFSWQGAPAGTDWTGPATGIADAEYGRQLPRFILFRSLISEYLATGDEQYAAKYLGFMTDFIADADASTSPSGSGSFPRSLDSTLRAQEWVQAVEVLRTSDSMDAEANADILKTVWKTANYLMTPAAYHPINNWGAYESQGLYYLSLYFPELVGSADWLSTSKQRLDSLISSLNYPDGSYSESSTSYAVGTAGIFLDVKKFGQFAADTVSPTFDSRLNAMGRYLMDISFPNGKLPNFGDGGSIDATQMAGSIAAVYGDTELNYFATAGSSGTLPAHTSTIYPDSNIAVMRDGWTPQDNYLFLNTKQDISHRHPDDNAVTVYGKGRPLLVDPGAYTYNADPVSTWLRTSTEAHNTITINGTAQDKSPGYLDSWTDNARFSFVEGVTKSTPGFTHRRDVLFLKSSYSIVSDHVSSTSGSNTYEQNWHFLPAAAPSIDSTSKATRTQFGDSLGDIQVIPADPGQISSSIEPGYYSDNFYQVADADYSSYAKTASGDVTFDTVLYPTEGGDPRQVTTTRLALSPQAPTTVASSLRIDNIGATGTAGFYYVSHEQQRGVTRGFDTFSTDGKVAYAEKTGAGAVSTALLKSGTKLTNAGNTVIRSNRMIDNIAVEWKAGTLEINGSGLIAQTTVGVGSAVAIRASGITTVKLNGQVVPFTESNGNVYAVAVQTWGSMTGFQSTRDLGPGHTGVQSIQFSVTPGATQLGGVIGYTGQQATATAESGLSAIVRLNASGSFDVRDGATYRSDVTVPYATGGIYHVTLLADVETGTYDVYVAPHGQPEVRIASRYAFNTTAPSPGDLGRVYLSAAPGKPFDVSHHKASAAKFVAVPVSADAMVYAANPSTNYSTAKTLEIRNSTGSSVLRQAYLKFDLSTAPGTAAFAKLQLTSASNGTFTDQLQAVGDDSWQESTITWGNKPSAGSVLASWSMPALGSSAVLDVTGQVNTELSGDKVLSLMLSPQTKNNVSHYYYSKENGSSVATLKIYSR